MPDWSGFDIVYNPTQDVYNSVCNFKQEAKRVNNDLSLICTEHSVEITTRLDCRGTIQAQCIVSRFPNVSHCRQLPAQHSSQNCDRNPQYNHPSSSPIKPLPDEALYPGYLGTQLTNVVCWAAPQQGNYFAAALRGTVDVETLDALGNPMPLPPDTFNISVEVTRR